MPNSLTLCIRSELKFKPHENAAYVFLTWTILPIEMDSDSKKYSLSFYFIPSTGGFMGVIPHPPPTYAGDPMLSMYPLRLRGYMISIWSAAYEGWDDKNPPSPTPAHLFKVPIHSY